MRGSVFVHSLRQPHAPSRKALETWSRGSGRREWRRGGPATHSRKALETPLPRKVLPCFHGVVAQPLTAERHWRLPPTHLRDSDSLWQLCPPSRKALETNASGMVGGTMISAPLPTQPKGIGDSKSAAAGIGSASGGPATHSRKELETERQEGPRSKSTRHHCPPSRMALETGYEPEIDRWRGPPWPRHSQPKGMGD